MQNLLPLLALCVAYFRAPRGFLPISFFVREKLISFFCFLPITLRCGSATSILTVYFTPTRLVLCPFFCFFFSLTQSSFIIFSITTNFGFSSCSQWPKFWVDCEAKNHRVHSTQLDSETLIK
jgi:hypothetical protein